MQPMLTDRVPEIRLKRQVEQGFSLLFANFLAFFMIFQSLASLQ